MLEQFQFSADQEVGLDERAEWIRRIVSRVADTLLSAIRAESARVRKVLVPEREGDGLAPRPLLGWSTGMSCSASRAG